MAADMLIKAVPIRNEGSTNILGLQDWFYHSTLLLTIIISGVAVFLWVFFSVFRSSLRLLSPGVLFPMGFFNGTALSTLWENLLSMLGGL